MSSPGPSAAGPAGWSAPRLVPALLLVAATVVLAGIAVERPLDHDEHQFVAAGAVTARTGALPYVDYPYFHTPYLVLVHAALFLVTDHLLLAARLSSTACALALLALLAGLARRRAPERPGVAVVAVLLLLANPLFLHTSGRAWNHDAAALLSIVAFLLQWRAVAGGDPRSMAPAAAGGSPAAGGETGPMSPSAGGGSPGAALAAGLAVGVGAGVRLSVLPLVAPLMLMPVLFPRPGLGRERLRAVAAFVAGLGIGLAPLAWLALRAPAPFLHASLGYHRINTLYRQTTGHETAMDATGKAFYFARAIVGRPGTFVLLALLAALVVVRWRRWRRAGPGSRLEPLDAVLWTLPFVLGAALAATPSWPHYFYALVPFLVVGVVEGLSRGTPGRLHHAAGATALVCVAFAAPDLGRATALLQPSGWFTLEAHAIGRRIAARAGGGLVLTLAPIYPLEGGLDVYPALVTSPFAWRTAHLLEPDERSRLGIVGASELDAMLARRPPGAVLVGHEPDLEDAFVAWARGRGYIETHLPRGGILFLPPSGEAGRTAHLAGSRAAVIRW